MRARTRGGVAYGPIHPLQTPPRPLGQNQQRLVEIEWRSEGLPLTPVERQDGFYDLLHDMHDDRIEYQEAIAIAAIDRQMDRLQQRETGQGQGREHGMGL